MKKSEEIFLRSLDVRYHPKQWTPFNMIKFYHRTKEERWNKIQKEGVLWGYRTHRPKRGQYRYTYLSPNDFGESYGSVLLEVHYEPTGILGIDNYGFNPPNGQFCWQFSVFVPISLDLIKRIN